MSKKNNKGQVIVCAFPDYYNSEPSLTLGKEYTVIDEVENKFIIKDDKGKETTYYQGRFKVK